MTPYEYVNSPNPTASPSTIISHATRVNGRRWMISAPIVGNRTTVERNPIVIRLTSSTKRRSPLALIRTMPRASPIAAIARIVARRRNRRASAGGASAASWTSSVGDSADSDVDIGAESTGE